MYKAILITRVDERILSAKLSDFNPDHHQYNGYPWTKIPI